METISDFINWLKSKLTKSANKQMQLDIERFENMFNKIYREAQQQFENGNTPTEEAGVMYEIINYNGKSEFVLDNKKDTEPQSARVNNKNIVQRSANSSVFIYSIPEVPTKVNTQRSIPENKADDEYISAVESGNITHEGYLTDTKR